MSLGKPQFREISDLLHLADTAGAPAPRHGLLDDAYQAYLAARDQLDRDQLAPPPAANPYNDARTTAHP